MKELVECMAKALVDIPDQVEVTEIVGEHTLVIEVKVAKEDMGKIIGKKGRNAQAMRTLLNAASAKLRKHVLFEIIYQ
ncbi:MAG: KH domain-containing protein [Syntrophobacteria bacterium]